MQSSLEISQNYYSRIESQVIISVTYLNEPKTITVFYDIFESNTKNFKVGEMFSDWFI